MGVGDGRMPQTAFDRSGLIAVAHRRRDVSPPCLASINEALTDR
jgi:hypothetical protein